MLKLSRRNIAVMLGGLAVAFPLSAGVASAQPQPDLGPIINTTCTYGQVMAALSEQYPDLAAELAQQRADRIVMSFLASSIPERRATVAMLQNSPTVQAYFTPISDVANTCNNY